MRKIKEYTTALLSILIAYASSAQLTAPSLTELMDSALVNDYTLMNQELAIFQSKLDQQQLKDAFLPRLTIAGSELYTVTPIILKTNKIEIPQLDLNINRGTNRFTHTSDKLSVGAEASMLLYSGGKIRMQQNAVVEKVNAQKLLTDLQKQDIISDLVATYDQLALLKQVRRVLDLSEIRLAENMKLSEKAFSYGLITKYEKQKIEVAQAQLASSVQEYDGKRALILHKLFLLTNIPFERLNLIDNTLQTVEGIAVQQTIENRPDLKALDAVIAGERYLIKAEEKWRIPKIRAQGSLGYMGSFFGHLRSSKPVLPNGAKLAVDLRTLQIAPAISFGVAFSWTLFDGNDGKRQVERAKLNLRTAENNKSDAVRKLELNLLKRRTDFAVAIAEVNTRSKQFKIAANAFDQAANEYRTGLIRTADLIDAEEDLREAELGWWQSIFDQRRAAIELLKATGNLNIQSLRQL